jgi:hypothetical protein
MPGDPDYLFPTALSRNSSSLSLTKETHPLSESIKVQDIGKFPEI